MFALNNQQNVIIYLNRYRKFINQKKKNKEVLNDLKSFFVEHNILIKKKKKKYIM
jgi:hypothetical protein